MQSEDLSTEVKCRQLRIGIYSPLRTELMTIIVR